MRSHLMARIACGILLGSFLLLGIGWTLDRSRPWEVPDLDRAAFVALRGEPGSMGRETWVMAINLGCPSCLARARRLTDPRWPARTAPRRVLLVVDQRRPPQPVAWSELRADAVWWDAAGTWRRRWGHRIYGEVLRFDRHGRYLGTTPPEDPPPAPRR